MTSFFERIKRLGSGKRTAKYKEQPPAGVHPKTQIWDDLIDSSENRSADIGQCLKDWNRGKERIFIGGISLEQILIDKKYTKVNEKGETVARDVDAKELQGIWEEYLLKGIPDEAGKKAMLGNLTKYMHQGGYLNMLQTSLFKIGTKLGFMMGGGYSKDIDPRFDIVVHGSEILMMEKLTVNALRSSGMTEQYPDADPEKPIATGDPLMIIESVYKLSLDPVKKIPECTTESITLEHHSVFTEQLFMEAQKQAKSSAESPRLSRP